MVFDIKNINFEELKLAKAGRAVKLIYQKEPLQFCTSALYTPFGTKSVNKEWSNFTEYSIDCSLNQATSDSAIEFKTFMEKLDIAIFQLVKENKHLFVNARTPSIPDEVGYTKIMRENGSYPKLVKLQLPRDKHGNFETCMFDESKEKIKVSEQNVSELLCKGKSFKCIIECSKVWYYNEKFGSIWNINQLKFSENKQKVAALEVTDNVYTNNMMLD